MSNWKRRLQRMRILIIPGILVPLAYWWLLIESHTPSGRFPVELAELRQLADALPGDKPKAIGVERVATLQFPAVAVYAGDGWVPADLPVYSYQLVFGSDTAIVDTALSHEAAEDMRSNVPFDADAFQRVENALEHARFAVVTHEHADHLGGFAAHPKAEQLARVMHLTTEQLSDPSKRKPLVLTEATLRKLQPLSYERMHAMAPGVVLVKARGHTPGSQWVYVRRADGEEFLFLGDVAWHHENWEQVHERARLVTLIMGEDREAVLEQLAAVRALKAAEPKLHVIPGHDGTVMAELLAKGLLTPRFQ